MNFIKTPVSYNEDTLQLTRQLNDIVATIDNFIELVVFTPRGNFTGDIDFGFEYWNHEYTNVDNHAFNSGQNGSYIGGLNNEITRRDCQESIKQSIVTYLPQIKNADVSIVLSSVDDTDTDALYSKRKVTVVVTGLLDDGLGTYMPYKKEVCFFMEPTIRKK